MAGESELRHPQQTIGLPDDAEATGNGSVIGVLKRLRTLLAGTLNVAVVSGGGTGGRSSTDKGAGTEGASSGTPAMGFFKDAATALTDGMLALARVTAYRALHVNPRRNDGSEAAPDQSGTVYINGTAYTVKRFATNVAASQTDAAVIAAVGGKALRILSFASQCGATATSLTFTSKPAGAGTAISMTFANGANGGGVFNRNVDGWMQTTTAEGLSATTGAGSTTGVQGTYIEI